MWEWLYEEGVVVGVGVASGCGSGYGRREW